jgi:hypothetical protein
MARFESDREDLMAEATALTQRAEFDVPGQPASVIAGYRRDGALSIYFGADPCCHFDSELQLRRAFVDGALYRTQGHTLARLQRSRSGQAVELVRRDLTELERSAFCANVADRLRELHAALQSGACCVQEVPPDAGLTERLAQSLEQLLENPIALAPAIRGKR